MTKNTKKSRQNDQEKVHFLRVTLIVFLLMNNTSITVNADDTLCTQVWTQVVVNDYISGAIQANGSYYAWGNNLYGGLGFGDNTLIQKTPRLVGDALDTWSMVVMTNLVTLGLKSDGSVYGWGTNQGGNLGTTPGALYNPTVIPGLENSVFIAATSVNTYAVKSDGTLWSLGDNSHGQLGVAGVANSNTAVQVGNDSDWASVYPSQDDLHTCGMKANKNLYCWGQNDRSQVGDGSNVDRSAPFLMGMASDTWVNVGLTQWSTMALATNGSLYGWGLQRYARFGVPNPINDVLRYSQPTQVAQLPNGTYMNLSTVAYGYSDILAVANDGTLWGWGQNTYLLAHEDSFYGFLYRPHQISTESDWVNVYITQTQASPGGTGFAFKSNESMYGWGDNRQGQAGIGSTDYRYGVPTQIVTGRTFSSVYGYNGVSAMIATSGELFMSGNNANYQLGDGTTTNSNIPLRVCLSSCDSSCATCNGPTVSDCTSCSGSRYLFNNTCLISCPDGYFGASNVCLKCDQACATCTETATTCTSCPSGTFLVSSTSQCVAGCPSKTYTLGSYCASCDITAVCMQDNPNDPSCGLQNHLILEASVANGGAVVSYNSSSWNAKLQQIESATFNNLLSIPLPNNTNKSVTITVPAAFIASAQTNNNHLIAIGVVQSTNPCSNTTNIVTAVATLVFAMNATKEFVAYSNLPKAQQFNVTFPITNPTLQSIIQNILANPLQFLFKDLLSILLPQYRCVFWDYTSSSWQNSGVMMVAMNSTTITCATNKTGEFAVQNATTRNGRALNLRGDTP